MRTYDFVFAGSGMAALMLVYKMLRSGEFDDRTFLLIDPSEKTVDDRTWCYWEEGDDRWDDVVSTIWEQAVFADEKGEKPFPLSPYRYKMVRSSGFYRKVLEEIERHSNVSRMHSNVLSFSDNGNDVTIVTDGAAVQGKQLFNSLYTTPDNPKYPVLLQHFTGWFIRTDKPAFDANTATLMDFSVPQSGNTRFMYVLPLSSTEALVEYTLFSAELLAETEYDQAIADYLQQKNITEYRIESKERGSIPMTTFPFWKRNSRNVLHIGTAGGWTKASTGYTFRNSDKKTDALLEFLKKETDLRKFHQSNRFLFYDALLLDILHRENGRGREIFSSLFRKADPATVLRFLDEETTVAQDLHVISSCPKVPFLRALARKIGL